MVDGKVGVCVIGAGRAGMIHARNFAARVPNAKLVAVADPVEEAAKAAVAELGIDKYYVDYKQALEDDRIDCFVIVTPTKFHVSIAKDIAAAKKHILCEKPMAMNAEECVEMNKAAEDNGIKLQLAFMRRFDKSFMRAKSIVESGAIGDVVMVRSNTRGPSVPQAWMYDLKKSNGPLAEVNSHDIDTLRWFTGSEFSSVYAIGGNYRSPEAKSDYPDFYDNVVMVSSFKNGMQGMIDGSQGAGYAYDARTEVLGTDGCVFIGRLHDDAVMTCTKGSDWNATEPVVASWRGLFIDAYLNEDIAFIDAILNDTEPLITGHDGEMAVRVVNAGNISITEKRIVTL